MLINGKKKYSLIPIYILNCKVKSTNLSKERWTHDVERMRKKYVY